MRVVCQECQHRARITNRNKLSEGVADLYCQCTNVHCGETFVMKLAFSHTITPAKNKVNELLFDFLKNMGKDKRREIINQVDNIELLASQ